MNHVICDIVKNKRGRLRVALHENQGCQLLSARIWSVDDIGRLLPARDGLTITLRHLAALREALSEAAQIAQQHGLIPAEGDHAATRDEQK